jgi:hypothetical protein
MSHKGTSFELIEERWRTERMYEDLKGELGIDHFEGRAFAFLLNDSRAGEHRAQRGGREQCDRFSPG